MLVTYEVTGASAEAILIEANRTCWMKRMPPCRMFAWPARLGTCA